jgi:hypothetical protein
MMARIWVDDRKEAEQIRKGLERADVRAFVKVMGILAGASPRAQRRILTFVRDKFAEEESK